MIGLIQPQQGSGAVMSEDGRHRLLLWRIWSPNKERLLWVGYNPSTADDRHNDPTITRIVRFTADAGRGGFEIVNLYSLRSRHWRKARGENHPEAPLYMAEAVSRCDSIVIAWGNMVHKRDKDEIALVEGLADTFRKPMLCLGWTKTGRPRHPLFVERDVKLMPCEALL